MNESIIEIKSEPAGHTKRMYSFSVLLITYNHGPYIEQAIESVLTQQFHYDFQIVIGIDKSRDNTAEVCYRYATQYPKLIKLIEHTENVGMFENFFRTFQECEGKYIAILEGDDYWTDIQKLEKQFIFFERYPNCLMTAGLANQLENATAKLIVPRSYKVRQGKKFFKEDIILSNRFTTLTTAFRSSAINWNTFAKFKGVPHLDWCLYLSLNYTEQSFAYRFNDIFGTYRLHSGGVYSQITLEKRVINTAKTVYYLYEITNEAKHKWYLHYLYVNLLYKVHNLDVSNFPFYQEDLCIYEKKDKLRSAFLSMASVTCKKFLSGQTDLLFKVKALLSLVHQTKTSYSVYSRFFYYPFITLAACKYWLQKLLRTFNL